MRNATYNTVVGVGRKEKKTAKGEMTTRGKKKQDLGKTEKKVNVPSKTVYVDLEAMPGGSLGDSVERGKKSASRISDGERRGSLHFKTPIIAFGWRLLR